MNNAAQMRIFGFNLSFFVALDHNFIERKKTQRTNPSDYWIWSNKEHEIQNIETQRIFTAV